jgi:ABC-type sugar transport system substrate-binding protein
MRNRDLHVTIIAHMALLCCGCHSVRRHRVISAIPRNTAEAYGVAEHAGLSEAAALNHVSIYWNGPRGGDDSEQQIVLVERAIEQNSMGIVLTPNAPFALDTVIQRALSHGIPVVVLGPSISLPPNRNLSFALNDAERAGELAAERIHRIVGDQGEIAIAGIDPMSPGSKDLADNFEASLSRLAPGIHTTSKLVGSFTFGQAELETEKMIEDYPRITAIYAVSVAATRGAVAAVRTSRKEGRISIVGSDQTLDLLFLLRRGAIDSLVIEDMRGLGMQAVQNIVATRQGHPVKTTTYYEPALIDRKNIDNEAIQRMLKMDWRSRE